MIHRESSLVYQLKPAQPLLLKFLQRAVGGQNTEGLITQVISTHWTTKATSLSIDCSAPLESSTIWKNKNMRNFHLACVQEWRLCHCVYLLTMENNHAILENFKVQANVLMKVKAIQDTVYYVNLNVLYANLRKVCSNFKNKGSWRHLWGVPLWSSYYLVSTKGALPYSWGCWCCPSRNCSGIKEHLNFFSPGSLNNVFNEKTTIYEHEQLEIYNHKICKKKKTF